MVKNTVKAKQVNDEKNEAYLHEFVTAETLALLFGTSRKTVYLNKHTDVYNGISTIKKGKNKGLRYNFNEAARLAYPTLSEYEIALLRIDIQDRIAKRRMKED
jgi:hypothetical protein